jgi:hypothetical protein
MSKKITNPYFKLDIWKNTFARNTSRSSIARGRKTDESREGKRERETMIAIEIES